MRGAISALVLVAGLFANPAAAFAQSLPDTVRSAGVTVAQWQAVQAEVRRVATAQGVSERALAAVAERMGVELVQGGGIDLNQLLGLIDSRAALIRELQEHLTVLERSDDPATAVLLRQARAAIESGDLDGAERVLAETRQVARTARVQAQLRETEVIKVAADVRALRLDYLGAAALYAEASETASQDMGQWSLRYWQMQALYNRGRLFNEPEPLREAVRIGVTYAMPLAPRETRPERWAVTQTSLGLALQVLGERGDDAALARSVQAFEAALTVLTREREPQGWAEATNNLGLALLTLGERGDDAALSRSVEAFQAAQLVMTRERDPVGWEAAQTNLGLALLQLGERGDAAALTQSIAAFEAALTIATRERDPDGWAATMGNLGNAFGVLGERGDGSALSRSAAAYEAALAVRTRERDPAGWALLQNNLGNALLRLGERGDGGALARGAAAYDAALTVRTRERDPQGWAETMHNLGRAQLALGERGDEAALARSIDSFRAALSVMTREHDPRGWANTIYDLAFALRAQGNTDGAREAARSALEVFERTHDTYLAEQARLFLSELPNRK
jgi:hypothetical protein